MALVGEGFAAGDANGGEEAPAADEAGLSGGEADFLYGQKTIVVKNVVVDHARSPRTTHSILTEKGQAEVQESIEAKGTTGIDCNKRNDLKREKFRQGTARDPLTEANADRPLELQLQRQLQLA